MDENLEINIWIEKYRPKSIKNMILPTKLKNYFDKIVESKTTIPNMLLHSVKPGTGKSSLAKALCRDLGINYLYINTSLERGIDTLRDNIQSYATTLSVDGGIKVAILDEFDGGTDILQKALRASMEEFSETCRFILTCNNLSKIIEPIKSRCEMIDFNFNDEIIKNELKPKISKRLIAILNNEKIKFDQSTVDKIIEVYYPDIRYIIKLSQQFSTMNGIISDDIFRFKQIENELLDLILSKKIVSIRKFIVNHGYDYHQLYKWLFDNLVPKVQKKSQIILKIADYMHESTTSLDPEITFTACLIEILNLL
jgi:replication factor C small subunit